MLKNNYTLIECIYEKINPTILTILITTKDIQLIIPINKIQFYLSNIRLLKFGNAAISNQAYHHSQYPTTIQATISNIGLQ